MWRHDSIQARALIYTMVFSASVHIAISFFVALTQNSIEAANMFTVLGISLIFPELGKGTVNAVLGALVVMATWTIIVLTLRLLEKKQPKRSKKGSSS